MTSTLTTAQKAKLDAMIREVLNLDSKIDLATVTPESYPAWDSLRHVALCLRLQNEFGVKFNGAELVAMRSYESIISNLTTQMANRNS